MKTISILFTEYTDFASRIVHFWSGGGYTHVSIALDEENEYFYSFNTKGFRKEYPKKHKNRTKKNVCYLLEVTEECFLKLKEMIKAFEEKKEKHKYNWIGMILLFLNISYKDKYNYYCTQFVTHLLKEANIIKWKHKFRPYFPNQIMKELNKSSLLKKIVHNPIPMLS